MAPGAVSAVPPAGFPFGAPHVPAPPPVPEEEEGPSAAKRARTEDALEPEHSWLARHPGPAHLQVIS